MSLWNKKAFLAAFISILIQKKCMNACNKGIQKKFFMINNNSSTTKAIRKQTFFVYKSLLHYSFLNSHFLFFFCCFCLLNEQYIAILYKYISGSSIQIFCYEKLFIILCTFYYIQYMYCIYVQK